MCKNKNKKYNDNVNQDIITDVIKEFPNSVKSRESAMIDYCASVAESNLTYPNIAIEACEKLLVELQEYKNRCLDINMRVLLESKLIDNINKLKDTNITEDDNNENKCLITDYYDALESLYTKIIYLEQQELEVKISEAYQEFFKTFVDIIKLL